MSDVTDTRDEIQTLVGFRGRGPGTDAERRAAQHVRARLEAIGRDVDVEATWIRPRWALAHTGCLLLAVVGSVLSTAAAVVGLVMAAVALVLLLADLSGRIHLARRLTGRRASQNVVSREHGDRHGTLVLVAHCDAAQSGFAYGAAPGWRAALGRRVGPYAPVVGALAVVVACAALRTGG